MTSSTRAFFIGVVSTFVILGAGFGGGLLMARNVMEPASPLPNRSADRLPPARVILPASAEAAVPTQAATANVPAPEPQAVHPSTSPNIVPGSAIQQAPKKDKAAERAERRKAEAEERDRRKRTAERKARREASRLAKAHEPQQRQPGIMAFGGDDEQPRMSGGFFGN